MAEKIIVLMIEDEQDSADVCLKTFRQMLPDVQVFHELDFGNAESRIKDLVPDIIILDVYQGDPVAEHSAAGMPIWTQIWRGKFCPLIFHTARELPGDPPLPKNHPFVKYVHKKAKSDAVVAGHLKDFLPHVAALRTVETEVFGVLQSVLREVANIVWNVTDDEKARDRILIRAARRRAAALMDEATLSDGKAMTSWEQWLVPALGPDLLMGDLLHAVGANNDDPTSYRIVLTPSCDMVKGRKRCADQILVAKCCPILNYLKSASLGEALEKKLREKLPVLLTQEECGGYVALPPLPGIFPVMAAGMRDLALVPITAIGDRPTEKIEFVRVASVDSPFREKFAWTYLQIAARPGTPDCDHEDFISSIVESVKSTTGGKKI